MELEETVRASMIGVGVFLAPFTFGVVTGMGRANGYDFSHAELLAIHLIPPVTGMVGGGAGLSEQGRGVVYGGLCATALMFGGQVLGYTMGQFLK